MFVFVLWRVRGFCCCAAKECQSHDYPPGRREKSSTVVVVAESSLSGVHVSVPQLVNAEEYHRGVEGGGGRMS
jgi:hypothetical protein